MDLDSKNWSLLSQFTGLMVWHDQLRVEPVLVVQWPSLIAQHTFFCIPTCAAQNRDFFFNSVLNFVLRQTAL